MLRDKRVVMMVNTAEVQHLTTARASTIFQGFIFAETLTTVAENTSGRPMSSVVRKVQQQPRAPPPVLACPHRFGRPFRLPACR